jgi:hypothetical protein
VVDLGLTLRLGWLVSIGVDSEWLVVFEGI